MIALTALHNFIRSNPGEIDYVENEEREIEIRYLDSPLDNDIEDNGEAKIFRDNIASAMWNEYQLRRGRNL